MANIKTRNKIKGSIKTIYKMAVVSEKIKQTYISTKEKAEHSTQTAENSAEEYASDGFESGTRIITDRFIHQLDKQGRNGVKTTKDNYYKAKVGIRQFKEKRTVKSLEEQVIHRNGRKSVKTLPKSSQAVKSTAHKSVKTAERTAKTSIKTAQQTAKTAKRTAQASIKTAQKAAQAAKVTAKVAVATAKSAVKATIAAVKAIIAGVKALVAAIATGGWIAVVVIIVICLVALLLSSVYGIFFSGEDSGTGMSMQTVVQEINTEYDNKIGEIKSSMPYNILEMSGSRAVWKDVLAVYAVKVNTDPNNPQEVATIDDNKKQLLKDIFWEMNSISSRTETKSDTVITETDDGNGNIVQTKTTVTQTYLYITVSHKSADEMAEMYGFNQEQKKYLTELLNEKNNQLWSTVLYGINVSDDKIVTVALSQIGNIGGEPYWSWYGFENRVEWCACFVSWCANECGYIDTGVIPKFSVCGDGANWFKNRGQWADKFHEPSVGTIIFFDWDKDGEINHVGIVQKCENGIVYTVEGNSDDSCRTKQYAVGSKVIYGYGIPAY